MNVLTEQKHINRLILLFTFTYMVSYITRINYGTVISEMEKSTDMSRSLLSMALTGSFITYGTGQIISGILGDRFSPKKLVSCGFVVTILMNILIPLCQSPYQMLAVALQNGDDIKTVQTALGHHSSAFTLQVYAHATWKMQTDSADRMSKFVENMGIAL